ncbi:cholesterol esterase [Phytophthora boehmeriae]|uniref:Cholesterol esterase n=1 Tax=Phytophthora boehmeriae TaxID=109152 RepID=A0A8T1WP29_9STRA|nr:cholesterol esterase [Phytophthora boehmeriae]
MYRLPKTHAESQTAGDAAANKPAVLLQHGLLDSSYTFVCNFRNQSLAYILADAGYDVWLGNNRGTTWSREHLDYNADEGTEFWDFSWEDMGKYDLPAEIEYVLNTSGRSTLGYVGHSEGNTQAFVGFSLDQELARKVSYFAAFAPAAWTSHMTAKVFRGSVVLQLDRLAQALGYVEFSSRSEVVQVTLTGLGCTLLPGLCNAVISFIAGSSISTNATRIPVYISQTPAGTSVKNMAHFAQNIRDGAFASYDYGCHCDRSFGIDKCPESKCKNKEVYGSFEAPEFPVSGMEYPRTGLFRGTADTIATAADVDRLCSVLPPGTIVHDLEVENFSHLDLTWAVDANKKLYEDLLAQLEKYADTGYSTL